MRTKWIVEIDGVATEFDTVDQFIDHHRNLPEGRRYALRAPDKITPEDWAKLDKARIILERMYPN
ncbi:MAG TPA: hypothetical protein VN112_16300 [Ensifer sp.]|nr:hypothetical protein [Ensifer sp.]